MAKCSMANLPPGFVFCPHGRDLVAYYLASKVNTGEVPGVTDSIAEGIDIYSLHPANLPFLRCNKSEHGRIWSYFFEVGPIAGEYHDTPEGYWCRYGDDKPYVDGDGQVIAFRSRFAFHGNDDNLTVWRMKEYRLSDGGSRQFGTPVDPKMKNYVVCKIYNAVEIPEEPEFVEFVYEDDEEEEEDEDTAASMQQ